MLKSDKENFKLALFVLVHKAVNFNFFMGDLIFTIELDKDEGTGKNQIVMEVINTGQTIDRVK